MPRLDHASLHHRILRTGVAALLDEEAKAIFDRFQLTGPTWDIPVAATRF